MKAKLPYSTSWQLRSTTAHSRPPTISPACSAGTWRTSPGLREAWAEATSPEDYPALSEQVAWQYSDFEAECGRFVLRMTLPGIPITPDEMDEPYERFLVELERTPGMDGRIGFGTRQDVDGFDHTLAGSGFFDGVVTVRGQDGHLRLVDGSVAHEGRLEIFLNEQWGTICDDYWTDEESGVACRQIGYPGAESNTRRFLKAHFGQGTGPIWLDNLLCRGNELLLTDCPRIDEGAEVGGHNCRHIGGCRDPLPRRRHRIVHAGARARALGGFAGVARQRRSEFDRLARPVRPRRNRSRRH